MLIPLLCLPLIASAQSNKVILTPKGDEITMNNPKERKLNIQGKLQQVTTEKPIPYLLNGRKIFSYKDESKVQYTFRDVNLWTEDDTRFNKTIEAAIKPLLDKLPIGDYEYMLKNMVVDEKGYIAYYETNGFTRYKPMERMHQNRTRIEMPEDIATEIDNKIAAVVRSFCYRPFTVNNETLPYLGSKVYHYSKRDKYRNAQLEAKMGEQIKKESDNH